MNKKIIAGILAAAAIAPPPAYASFKDVNENSAEYETLYELEALGIIDGDENGSFNPYNSVTRSEFTKMLIIALGEEQAAQSMTTSRFADCADHWAAGYIEIGVSDGFINGYDDTHFGPDDNITYAQAVKMLVAAVGYTSYAENSGGWPSGYLKYGSSLGITKGVTDAVNDTVINRRDAAILLYHTLDVPLVTADLGYQIRLKVLDGKEGRDYETLLTARHDVYRVKGRITDTSRSSGLKKGYVYYRVESSNNFDGTAYDKKNTETFPMYVGGTDMTGFLFIYSEALVKKTGDEDYKIISIKGK